MKKTILATTLLLVSIVSFGQCDFKKNGKDEFTGDIIKIQNEYRVNKKFTSKFWFSISFGKINENFFLNLKYTSGQKPSIINVGNELYIKLINEEVIKLKTISSYVTDVKVTQYGSVFNISPSYDISKEDLEKIKNIGISKIRMYNSDMYYESDFVDNDNTTVKELVMCITQ